MTLRDCITEFDYRIILWTYMTNYIETSYYRTRLWSDMSELYYEIMLRNYIMELWYKIVLRNDITELPCERDNGDPRDVR